jgi:predicted TIM-barrel fold metal-dependent hydrolase
MTTTGYQLISADSHVVEPPDLFETRLPSGLRDRAPKLAEVDGGDAWIVEGADPVPLPQQAATGSAFRRPPRGDRPITFAEVLPALHDPAERVKAQDADGVAAEVLYPSTGLWDALKSVDDPELQLACIRAYNDWIAEFCAHAPDRLFGVAKIPSTNGIDAAVEELQRGVDELGLRGVLLDAWPSGAEKAADPADDPFWAAAAAAGVPVSVHWGLGRAVDTEAPTGIAPGVTPPMADVVLPLIVGRVFDRNPDLELVLAHGDAGWLLHWLEFRDITYVRHRHLNEYALEDPDAVPSDYFRRHCWFTFGHDRSSVKNRDRIGPVHLMWASHFPLDVADWPDDRQAAMRITEEVADDDRRALLAGNVGRLYRLPGYEQGFSREELDQFEALVHF